MIACERSDDDSCTSAKPSGGYSAKRARQGDLSVLFHGLCAAVIALTVLRILPALIACLVTVCVLQSPGLRTLSNRLFRFLGLRGRGRSAEANGSNVGVGGRFVSLRNQPASPPPPSSAPSTNDSDVPPTSDDDAPQQPPSTNGRVALLLVRRHLRFLMSAMRSVQRFVFVRRKRSRRSSRRCRDTASRARTVTTVTACKNIVTKTVETVTGFRTANDFAVRCSQRYSATREQRWCRRCIVIYSAYVIVKLYRFKLFRGCYTCVEPGILDSPYMWRTFWFISRNGDLFFIYHYTSFICTTFL